jgi:hypothetical protein
MKTIKTPTMINTTTIAIVHWITLLPVRFLAASPKAFPPPPPPIMPCMAAMFPAPPAPPAPPNNDANSGAAASAAIAAIVSYFYRDRRIPSYYFTFHCIDIFFTKIHFSQSLFKHTYFSNMYISCFSAQKLNNLKQKIRETLSLIRDMVLAIYLRRTVNDENVIQYHLNLVYISSLIVFLSRLAISLIC